MKKLTLIIAVGFMVTVFGAAGALAVELAGMSSISISGTHNMTTIEGQEGSEDFEINTTTILLGYAYYPVSFLELKGGVLTMRSEYGENNENYNYGLVLDVNYLFVTQSMVIPFAGVNMGYIGSESKSEYDGDVTKSDSSSFSYGAQGGIKFFASENVSLDVEGRYTLYTYESKSGDYTYSQDANEIRLFAGMSYYF